MKENCCAFTGHRQLGTDFDLALLHRVVEGLMKRGIDTFYCGMAKGFDLTAGEAVLKFKGKYKVKLIACSPYEGQAEYFSFSDKERYKNILNYCDEKVIFSKEYSRWCMHARDRYMADNSGVIVCYLRKNSGGTFYTVNYAKSIGLKIIEV